MKELLVTAKTVEKALEIGYEKLNVSAEQCSYEIINLPKKSFFGKIKQQAEVKIFIIDDNKSEKCCCDYEKNNDKLIENKIDLEKKVDVEIIKQKEIEFLNQVLSKICGNNRFEFSVDVDEKISKININCEEPKMVIGKKGETLDSIQHVLSLTISNLFDFPHRIHLDCNGYRVDREKYIENLAKKSAAYVLETKRNKFLDGMNSYERRIVHSIISEIDGVNSSSTGIEPNRKIIISIENK